MKRQRDIAQGSDAGAKTDELWQKYRYGIRKSQKMRRNDETRAFKRNF
jgi:hypothetical protein